MFAAGGLVAFPESLAKSFVVAFGCPAGGVPAEKNKRIIGLSTWFIFTIEREELRDKFVFPEEKISGH